jgi:hypothetical protein
MKKTVCRGNYSISVWKRAELIWMMAGIGAVGLFAGVALVCAMMIGIGG